MHVFVEELALVLVWNISYFMCGNRRSHEGRQVQRHRSGMSGRLLQRADDADQRRIL